jgi:hypothetical protein
MVVLIERKPEPSNKVGRVERREESLPIMVVENRSVVSYKEGLHIVMIYEARGIQTRN